MEIKPILFNTDMVRAILDGRKTVTRRVVKRPYVWNRTKRLYNPGDVLYVRETFCTENGKYYFRGDFEKDYLDPCETLSGAYPASCTYHPGCDGCMRGEQRILWHPSIHMPREAARIFLRVTGVRVERLQDITDEQAKAEGANWKDGKNVGLEEKMRRSAIDRFAEIWNSTIKPADLGRYGWIANPWIWVIEFERCEKPKDFLTMK